MLNILLVVKDAAADQPLVESLKRGPLRCEVVVVTTAAAAEAAVRAAEPPFDIILIDQQLGPGVDGIEVLATLLALSPSSEALVFTVAGDEDAGLRAYLAGAYSYLPRPFSMDEFHFILESLWNSHTTRHERDWLRILAEVPEAAQKLLPLREMSQVIVESGKRFGFERARCWLVDHERGLLVGLSQSGNIGLEHFEDFQVPPDPSLYFSRALSGRDPYIFHGQEFGDSYLYRSFGAQGYRPPTGDWVMLPLWAADRCLGLLALDNHTDRRHISLEERQLLSVFGKQVAAALERALLYEQEQRARQELEVLTLLGRHISGDAELENLINEMPALLRPMMPVSAISLAIYSDQTGRQDVLISAPDHPDKRAEHERLLNEAIARGQPLVSDGRTTHPAHEQEPSHAHLHLLLCVPLRVKQQPIGAILVQSPDPQSSYSPQHVRILTTVADQIVGALLTLRLKEQADRTSQRLGVLQRFSEELLRLSEQNDTWSWHATLTAITAGYALGFNRAMLFLSRRDSLLRGELGIGHFVRQEALASWRKDGQARLSLEQYLDQLKRNQIAPTPLSAAVERLSFDVQNGASAFKEALDTLQRVIVPEEEVLDRLPRVFVETFGRAEYAIFPLFVGTVRLGVIVTDNIHNSVPVENMPLDELETLLTQAALLYENKRQREASQQLIDVSNKVLALVSNQPLQTTLTQICEAALVIARADCVVIYPTATAPNTELHFDLERTGHAGLRREPQLARPPRIVDVLKERLLRGELVPVEDVRVSWHEDDPALEFSFLKREQIRAFIVVPIQDRDTSEFIGALHLNYRSPQTFQERDWAWGRSVAELAAAVIHSRRISDLVEHEHNAHQNELQKLTEVLEQARKLKPDMPSSGLDVIPEQLIRTLLEAATQFLDQPDARIGLLLREWERESPAADPKEFRRQYFLVDGRLEQNIERDFHRGITGRVFETGEDLNVEDVSDPQWQGVFYEEHSPDTRSELDVVIPVEDKILGLFNIESPTVKAFDEHDLDSMRRLARLAGLVLDNVRRQRNLDKVLRAAEKSVLPPQAASEKSIVPSGLPETMQTLERVIVEIAPEIAAVTIWYKEPTDDRAYLWQDHLGLRHPGRIFDAPAERNSPVWRVMTSSEPIFVSDARTDPRLAGRFVEEEAIVSAAGLPLRAEDGVVGAMFLNYRGEKHVFTTEERSLFSILATVAAANIRDTLRVDALERERAHLNAAMQITRAVGTELDLDQTLQNIMQALQSLFSSPPPQICVLTNNPATNILIFSPASQGSYKPEHIEWNLALPIKDGKSIACRVARASLEQKQPVFENIGNVHLDPDYIMASSSTQSQLSLALMSADHQQLLGVLVLERPESNPFPREIVELIRGVGPAISIAIERTLTIKDLEFTTLAATATLWASEIVHDVKNAIGKISYRIHPLRQQLMSPSNEQQWNEIQKNIAHLANMTNGPEADLLETFEIDRWLDRYITQMLVPLTHAERRTIQVQRRLNSPNVRVRASSMMLERGLHHLARNAMEEMPEVGQLTIQSRLLDDHWVEVQMIDNGPGVPEHVQAKLFQGRFTTKSEQGRNRGRGLIIVRMIIEVMNGKLYLLPPENPPGAVFAFRLPIVQPHHALEVAYESGR